MSCVSTPINEKPMYGGAQFTEYQNKVNQEFINSALEDGLTKEQASKEAVDFGWQYLRKKDYSTAIKRFNQGWLLNPQNPDVFYGFGDWYGFQNKYDQADSMFKIGLSIKPDHVEIMRDLAYNYNLKGMLLRKKHKYEESGGCFKSAIILLEKASSIDPQWGDIYLTWSASLMQLGHYEEALKKAEKAKALGSKLEEGYIEYLKSNLR